MSITSSDPLFATIAPTLNAQSPEFLEDVADLINDSPTLTSLVQKADSAGQELAFGSSSIPGLDGIQGLYVPTISSVVNQTVSGPATTDLNSVQYLVSQIAYTLGQSEDQGTSSITHSVVYRSTDGQVLAALAAEGFGYAYQAQAELDIEASPDATNLLGPSRGVYFDPYADGDQDSRLLQLLQSTSDTGQRASIVASGLWNQPEGGGTVLTTLWNSFAKSTLNYLNINPSAITNVSLVEDSSGLVQSALISTATNNYELSGDGNNATVTNSQGTPLYSEGMLADPSGERWLSFSGNNTSFTTQSGWTANSISGNGDRIFDGNASPLSVGGNNNAVFMTGNVSHSIWLEDGYQGNTVVAQQGSTVITGSGAGTTIFSYGTLNSSFDGGLFVLSGPSTVTGGTAQQTIFASGNTSFQGGSGYADFIGSSGTDTISAANGGGWFEGGSGGNNKIIGSDSGLGTILMAGGNGDTITGGTNGGDYVIAASGNETLTSGNDVGTDYFFLGSGMETVNLTGSSIVDTAKGSADITLSGVSSTVYGGSGGIDTFSATTGTLDVYGFRLNDDRISGSIHGWTYDGKNTTITMNDGASVVLHDVAYGVTGPGL